MNIPEEAIEKAAYAIRETAKTHPRTRSMDGPAQLARAQAHAALSAAAPLIKAQAWDEGCLHGSAYPYGEHGLSHDDNPYRKEQS